MKKFIGVALVLILLLSCASAERIGDKLEVINCNEWITLREDPSTKADSVAQMTLGDKTLVYLGDENDDFAALSYNGQLGYALKKYLGPAQSYAGEALTLDEDQAYNVNLFLSNFSEQGFALQTGFYSEETASPSEVLDFAINHIRFNNADTLDHGVWGPFNTRLSSGKPVASTSRYLNKLVNKGASEVFTLKGNFYYWDADKLPGKNGFVCFDSMEKLDEDRLSVYFRIYGDGEKWSNKVLRLPVEEISQKYWQNASGHAVIHMNGGDLDDRSTWYLEQYSVVKAK